MRGENRRFDRGRLRFPVEKAHVEQGWSGDGIQLVSQEQLKEVKNEVI